MKHTRDDPNNIESGEQLAADRNTNLAFVKNKTEVEIEGKGRYYIHGTCCCGEKRGGKVCAAHDRDIEIPTQQTWT